LVTCDKTITPQQYNGYDCGVFISMFADFISEDIPLLNFNQSDMPLFREKICLHITSGELSYSIR
jgi:Ulp1 family protease